MTIARCVRTNVDTVVADVTIRDAARVFAGNRIRILPIVGNDNELLGAVDVHALLDLALPDFVHFIADVDFVHDFGAVEGSRPDTKTLHAPITTIMKEALAVKNDCHLLRAYSLMLQHKLDDVLVVSEKNILIGIASLEDVSALILSDWEKKK